MKNFCFGLFFFLGGFAHELRNPVNCQCLAQGQTTVWRAGERKRV